MPFSGSITIHLTSLLQAKEQLRAVRDLGRPPAVQSKASPRPTRYLSLSPQSQWVSYAPQQCVGGDQQSAISGAHAQQAPDAACAAFLDASLQRHQIKEAQIHTSQLKDVVYKASGHELSDEQLYAATQQLDPEGTGLVALHDFVEWVQG